MMMMMIIKKKMLRKPRIVVTKVVDCKILECEFELYSDIYIHFWTNTLGKGMNIFIPLKMC